MRLRDGVRGELCRPAGASNVFTFTTTDLPLMLGQQSDVHLGRLDTLLYAIPSSALVRRARRPDGKRFPDRAARPVCVSCRVPGANAEWACRWEWRRGGAERAQDSCSRFCWSGLLSPVFSGNCAGPPETAAGVVWAAVRPTCCLPSQERSPGGSRRRANPDRDARFNWNVSIRWTESTPKGRGVPDRNDERELIVADILRRRGEGLGPVDRCEIFRVKDGGPRTFQDPTFIRWPGGRWEGEAGNA